VQDLRKTQSSSSENLYMVLSKPPRVFYQLVRDLLLANGFTNAISDTCVFVKKVNGKNVYVAVYVDDMLLFAQLRQEIDDIKGILQSQFEIDDRGEVDFILGMKVIRDRNNKTIRISHHRYISDLLERVGFEGSKSSCGTPLPAGYQFNAEDKSVREEEAVRANEFRSVIGSLMYLAHWSRPDLMYSVSTLSSFCNFPSENHWRGVHHILSFLNATRDRGITYGCVSEEGRNQISAYADADYAGDIISRRSRTGYVVILSS
jgi:hypothetical protein